MTDRLGLLEFDEETGRQLEAMYSTPEVAKRRRMAIEAAVPIPGDHGLDIGPGPGFLACELAELVGPSGRIAAIDTNPAMLAMTRLRAEERGLMGRVELLEGDAAALPFPDRSFHFVVAVQIYEYVPDMDRALAEAARVLRPGGRLVIIDTDWDAFLLHSGDTALTDRVIRAWDEHLVHRTLPRLLPGMLRRAGLGLDWVRPIANVDTGYEPDGFAAGLIDLIASFARDRAGVTSSEVDAWLADLQHQAAAGAFFFSVNQYCFRALVDNGSTEDESTDEHKEAR